MENVLDAIERMGYAAQLQQPFVARRTIQQFVAKIVIKQQTGTLYYTFPFIDELYI